MHTGGDEPPGDARRGHLRLRMEPGREVGGKRRRRRGRQGLCAVAGPCFISRPEPMLFLLGERVAGAGVGGESLGGRPATTVL